MSLPAEQDISAQQRQARNEFSPGWQKWNARVVFPWSVWVARGTK